MLLITITCGTAAKAVDLKTGETAPNFSGNIADGKSIQLSDFKDKVVLLDFWATWCGPCRAETPNVISAYKYFHPLGFEVIGINLDKDKEQMQAYVKEKNLQGHQIFNGKGWEDPIAQQYQVTGIPTMIVLDKGLKVYSLNARGYRLYQSLIELFGIDDSLEQKAKELETLTVSGQTQASELAGEGFTQMLFDEPFLLNRLAWKWANDEKTNYQAAVLAAQKAVQLKPQVTYILDTLAYAELGAGYYDKAVEHFSECLARGMTESSPRLATALVLRKQPGDLEKAYEIIEQSVSAGFVDRYVQEAVDALKKVSFDDSTFKELNDLFQAQKTLNELLNSNNLLDPEQAKTFLQNTTRFNGHDYRVFRVPLTWEKARIRCLEMGGYLACITSPEENEFIVNLARKDSCPDFTCCWIGSREDDWGDFIRWVSGESLQMNDYVINESPQEHYLNLRLQSGRWEDYPNTGEKSGGQWFVCEWPSDESIQDHPELALTTLAECPTQRELLSEIAQAKKMVKAYEQGYVIVGRVVLDGEGDVREVCAQMEILSGGYFAGPVKDLNRPVGFRKHQYAPYDLQLKGNQAGGILDVGTFHMKPLKTEELQDFKAKVVLEDGGDLLQAKVMLSVMNGPVNTPHNGTSPRPFWPQPVTVSAQKDGSIEASGFSPIEYYCIIDAPDYLRQAHPVEFTVHVS